MVALPFEASPSVQMSGAPADASDLRAGQEGSWSGAALVTRCPAWPDPSVLPSPRSWNALVVWGVVCPGANAADSFVAGRGRWADCFVLCSQA